MSELQWRACGPCKYRGRTLGRRSLVTCCVRGVRFWGGPHGAAEVAKVLFDESFPTGWGADEKVVAARATRACELATLAVTS